MRLRRSTQLLVLCVFTSLSVWAADESAPNILELPWSLRDHYTITTADQQMYITYAGDNGQWSLDIKGIGTVINKAGATVTLADGTVVDLQSLGVGDTTRNKTTDELGPGLKYQVTLTGPKGLKIVHSITYHDNHPFYIVRVELTNTGNEPIDIGGISPIVIAPGGFGNLSAETTESPRRFEVIGASPVCTTTGDPLYSIFHDPAKNATIAMGGLPVGRGTSSVHLEKFDGRYQGNVTTTFDPPLRLDPGNSLSSDPIFISFTLPKPSDVDMYFAWAQANMPNAKSEDLPECWVTVPDGDALSDLLQAVSQWNNADVQHALIPVTWEGRPGSLEGAQPQYPKDMAGAASQLRQAGVTPGITVDPLAVVDGKDDWTALSVDGQRWLNPATDAGRQYGIDRMRKVARWGFGFYVVAPSHIPDEILKHFNLTRAEADALAFQIMAEAAPGATVVGASAATLDDTLDPWLLAAASTCRLHEYSVQVGPVRLDAAKTNEISDDLVTAMTFFGGPIELVGKPSTAILKKIGAVFPKPGLWPRALDAGSPSPRLWAVHVLPDKGISEQLAIVSFPGARSYTDADLALPTGAGLKRTETTAAEFLESIRR